MVAVTTATLWTAPDRTRPLDAPALAVPADVRGWSAAMTADDRLDLHGRVESQVLLGDEVVVVDERDGWVCVVVPSQASSKDTRGYPGWLPAAQLTDAASPGTGGRAVVAVPTTTLYATPDGPPVLADVSFATVLPIARERRAGADPYLPVHVPGFREPLWVPTRDVAVDPAGRFDPADLLGAAGQFVGLPYLWGGTSGLGLDCSALVYTVLRRFGVKVPRDAHDQAAAAPIRVGPGESAAGDLLFFAAPDREITHVGICAGAGEMLHAPETGRVVVREPLPEPGRRHLVAAGRWA